MRRHQRINNQSPSTTNTTTPPAANAPGGRDASFIVRGVHAGRFTCPWLPPCPLSCCASSPGASSAAAKTRCPVPEPAYPSPFAVFVSTFSKPAPATSPFIAPPSAFSSPGGFRWHLRRHPAPPHPDPADECSAKPPAPLHSAGGGSNKLLNCGETSPAPAPGSRPHHPRPPTFANGCGESPSPPHPPSPPPPGSLPVLTTDP